MVKQKWHVASSEMSFIFERVGAVEMMCALIGTEVNGTALEFALAS